MVTCLELSANLHMAQLMPLPLTVSCFSKIRLVLPFWYRLTRVVLEKGPLNGCVCVCHGCVLCTALVKFAFDYFVYGLHIGGDRMWMRTCVCGGEWGWG